MPRSPRRRTAHSPHVVLELHPGAGRDEILAARKRLAKVRHPDAGGSVEAMQELNDAVEAALDALEAPNLSSDGPTVPPRGRSSRRPRRAPPSTPGVRRDHPSFTVEALPVVAFEGLLLAAQLIGEVVEEDPPYRLQVVLSDPGRCWSELELVPDAGATTVALAVGRLPGYPTVDLDEVRDRWIDALNRLDWSDPVAPQPPS